MVIAEPIRATAGTVRARSPAQSADDEKLPTPRPLPPPAPQAKLNAEPAVVLSAARYALARGDFNTAIPRFEEYLARSPNDYDVRKEFAGVLLQTGRRRAAE
jgi:hypothetical protein